MKVLPCPMRNRRVDPAGNDNAEKKEIWATVIRVGLKFKL